MSLPAAVTADPALAGGALCEANGFSQPIATDDCLTFAGKTESYFAAGDYAGEFVVFPEIFRANKLSTFGPSAADQMKWESTITSTFDVLARAQSDLGGVQGVVQVQRQAADLSLSQSYVSVADTFYAGIKDSLFSGAGAADDDSLLDGLRLLEDANGGGVNFKADLPTGGQVIHFVYDVNDGLIIGAGFERLERQITGGTAIGTVQFTGKHLSGHGTFLVSGLVNGAVEKWGLHAGATYRWYPVILRAAVAADSTGYAEATATASFSTDRLTIAAVADFSSGDPSLPDDFEIGYGASADMQASEAVAIIVSGRYFDSNQAASQDEGYYGSAQVVLDLSEQLQLTGTVGVMGETGAGGTDAAASWLFFSGAELFWSPGGRFTSVLGVEVFSNGAHKTAVTINKAL